MALARSISARRDVTVLFLKNLLRSVNSRGKELRENTENAPAARMSKEAGFTQFLTHELTPLSSSEFKFPCHLELYRADGVDVAPEIERN